MATSPSPQRRAAFLRWLRRVHAWTGFWGAIAFLLMGASGILLNHRNYLKIDTGGAREVSSADFVVDPRALATADDLGRWAQHQFHATQEAKAPRSEGRDEGKGARVQFAGALHDAPKVWKREIVGPNGRIEVSYVVGGGVVHAARSLNTPLTLVKNLHKGNGLPVLWVLFIDTIAGALLAQSLTGVLLWTRLHGPRLLAAGLMAGSIVFGLVAAWNAFV